MIIIGEKINGSIPSVAKAIAERNEEWIMDLAKKQADAGADFIDCCASVDTNETETLGWLIGLIRRVTDTPISIDSPSARVCVEAMRFCDRPGLINSVSGEGDKLDVVFPAIADTEWEVMALLCSDKGIPQSAADRIRVLDTIMVKAKEYGIAESRIHIDPLVEMLCTAEEGISVMLEVMAYARERYPAAHRSGAISNISYNLPYRKIVNIAFAVTLVNAGMSSAVLDPLNRDLRGAIYAAEALRGDDYYCMEYISAFREGIFGPVKNGG